MKKFFVYILIVFIVNTFFPTLNAYAKHTYSYKSFKGIDAVLIKDKTTKRYGLSKNNKIIVFPDAYVDNYTDWKILNYKGQKMIMLKGYYYLIYSPDNIFADIFPAFYSANNENNNIIFQNFPNSGANRYTPKKMITIRDNIFTSDYIIIDDDKLDFYDFNSVLGSLYRIALFKDVNNPKTNVPSYIEEDVKIENGKMIVTFKDIIVPYHSVTYLPKNIHYSSTSGVSTNEFLNQNLSKSYSDMCSKKHYCFKNYPLNAMIVKYGKNRTKNLYIFENGIKTKSIEDTYSNFYFSDKNSVINKKAKINIFFNSQNYIIAQKDDKWGVIDKNNKQKIPFIYDKILPVGGYIIESIGDKSDEFYYIGHTKLYNLFIVTKGNETGVIDDKNNIVVPFYKINLSNYPIIDYILLSKDFKPNKHPIKRTTKAIGDFFFTIFAYMMFPFFWLAFR